MGEANYYLKATFKDAATLEKQLPSLRAFFEEGWNAYNFWQRNRSAPAYKFWPKFKSQFPLATELLGKRVDGDCNNALAGEIDFVSLEDAVFKADGNALYYGGMVWHFADWRPLCKFLKTKFGATTVDYYSDEYSRTPAG